MDLKKPIAFIVAGLMVFSLFSIALVSTQGMDGVEEEVDASPDESLLGYTSRSPIRIDGNDEFANSTAVSNPGAAGNETDPYIIEGWEIDGGGYGYCIYIGNTTDHFVVRDCYLHNASSSNIWTYFTCSGLTFYNVEHGKIKNNTLSSNEVNGIYIKESYNNILSYNNVSLNNESGIRIVRTDKNIIENNNIYRNEYIGLQVKLSSNNILNNNSLDYNQEGGIEISWSTNSILENNTMIDNGITLLGNKLNQWNTHNISTNNTVNGKPVYYRKNKSDEKIPLGAGEVILANCTGMTVENQNLNEGSNGILIGYSENNKLMNNTASSNDLFGIYIYSSNNNTISNNSAPYNKAGILVYYSQNNTLENNTALSNNMFGIYLESNIRITMKNNSMVNNSMILHGDNLEEWVSYNISTSNTVNGKPVYYRKNKSGEKIPSGAGEVILANCTDVIVENQKMDNSSIGIILGYSNNNTVIKNTLINEYAGIYLYESHMNLIYHNNFINNTYHASDKGNNYWNASYPTGGNYWSDYGGYDNYSGLDQNQLGADGIGDSPYDNITGSSNADEYPLMTPFDSKPEVLQTTPDNDSTGVSVDQNISIVFSKSMNTSEPTLEQTDGPAVSYTFQGWSTTIRENDTATWNHTDWSEKSTIGLKIYDYNDTDGNSGDDHSWSFMTVDNTPPVIFSVEVKNITGTSAVVNWTTDESSNSSVTYSTNSDLSSNSTATNSTMTTSHFVNITDLSSGTDYYFKVSSTDQAGNTAEDDNGTDYYKFKTPISDTTPPDVTDATTNTPTTGDGFTLKANVTDNEGVDSVEIVYWFSGSEEQDIMSKDGENWTVTIGIPDNATDLHYKFNATDVNGNWKNSEEYTLQVTDNDPPATMDQTPKTATTGDPFIFNFTIIDNIQVDEACVEYWPDDDRDNSTNKSLSNIRDDTWTLEITIPAGARDLNYDVTAVDEEGNSASRKDISTSIFDNDPPTAEAGDDVEVYLENSVEFNASSSTDNTGIYEYRWTSEDIDGFELEGETASYRFNTSGTYNITLTVTDHGNNQDSDELVVTVSESKDTDGDGIPDEDDPDTDGDGIPDEWEIEYGFDPENRYDAFEDPDNDNLTNIEEYNEGTDPLDPDTDGDGIPDGEDPLPLESLDEEDDSQLPWWVFVIIAAVSAVLVFFFINWYSERTEVDGEEQEIEDEEKEIED